jgi:hypothetical protein
MPYSSLFNHLEPITHYVFSFLILYVFFPVLLFQSSDGDKGEKVVSHFMKMVLLMIVLGYFLVITKLYEVISILILLSSILMIRYWKELKKLKQRTTISYSLKSLFDFMEGLHFTNLSIMKTWLFVNLKRLSTLLKEQFIDFKILEHIVFLSIIAITIYIRFYDVIMNAAPPLSDSYVTLAWMKYIDARELFRDGIYPQGFHIYLSTLYKFAAIDGMYVLRYTGPFNAVLIMAGLYFCIIKMTGNRMGAMAAASLYGCFPVLMEWFPLERQVATNSQEFAFVFIFPVVFFLLKYCLSNQSHYLISGMAGTAVIGLVHSFAYVFIGLLIGILIICYFIQMRSFSQTVRRLIGWSILTVVLTVIPMGIGLLIGKDFHSSSVDYLLAQSTRQEFPAFVWIDYVALAFLSIQGMTLLILKNRLSKGDRFVGLFAILSGIITFTIYYFGGVLTNSVLVSSRSLEFWGLMVPFSIGASLSLLCKYFPVSLKSRNVALLFCFFLAFFIVKPSPIIGYKLEHNEAIEQYFVIRNLHLPKSWLLVSNDEGYAVVLGTGFHMHIGDFITEFDPKYEALTRRGETGPDETIPPYIYILVEKNLFKVAKSNSIYSLLEPKYNERLSSYRKFGNWLDEHLKHNHRATVFYEDRNIIIYRLISEAAKERLDRTIWSK